jgi:hypothetical protein
MNLLLFLITIISSFTVVRIGAVAFELTGLEWSLAKFQALSCFTGTGFTTKESELIVNNIQRRHIASFLMILGNAGLVTIIATFANSLRQDFSVARITIPFIDLIIPSALLPWVNLTVIILGVYFSYRLLARSKLANRITVSLRRYLIGKKFFLSSPYEELIRLADDYIFFRVEAFGENSPLAKDGRLKDWQKKAITVLAVEREERIFSYPLKGAKPMPGDKLLCFGRAGGIRTAQSASLKNFAPDRQSKKRDSDDGSF